MAHRSAEKILKEGAMKHRQSSYALPRVSRWTACVRACVHGKVRSSEVCNRCTGGVGAGYELVCTQSVASRPHCL